MEKHGADIYTAAEKSGRDENSIIDFSSNINPLGIPESVIKACINSIDNCNKYPDINSRELVKAIAEFENVKESQVFVSNGAAEAIFRIPFYLKPERALVTAPAFSEYESALQVVYSEVFYYKLKEENNFKIQDDIINYIDSKIDMVFLCNPNNPTGQITDFHLLEKIIAHCKNYDIYVVVDECFLDFVENKDVLSTVKLLDKYDNVIVLKAFTKIYAIPGIRLGYALCSNNKIIEGLKVSGPPWNVSNIAQAAGIKALQEKDYVIKTVEFIKEQRSYLQRELNKLSVKTYGSHANYILFKINKDIDLKEELLKYGVLIRSCSNYNNLDSSFYRIAVKTKEENALLINKLKEVLGR